MIKIGSLCSPIDDDRNRCFSEILVSKVELVGIPPSGDSFVSREEYFLSNVRHIFPSVLDSITAKYIRGRYHRTKEQ